MLDGANTLCIAGKELRDARRNRWFLFYAVAFGVLSLALSWFGVAGIATGGIGGFGRTTASLINLVILVVPLMGLTLGALSFAQEREQGTLLYMLAQPITPGELLFGKFIGLTLAMVAAIALGFGASGLVIALRAGVVNAGAYLFLVSEAALIAAVSLVLGILISVTVRRAATAVGIAIFVWLTLVFLGDLGVMSATLVMELGIRALFLLTLINPLQVFRVAAMLSVRGDLEVLGPVGQYALRTYDTQLVPLLLGILGLWLVGGLGLTLLLFRRRGAL